MRKGLIVLLLLGFLFPQGLLFAVENPYDYPVSTVIIDAGHGGYDPGTSSAWVFAGGTIFERDISLDIAKRVYALLSVIRPDLQLVMTRSDDTFVSLEDRSRIAYTTELPLKTSALFVSIHVNSAENNEARGFEVLTKKQGKSVTLLNSETPTGNIVLYSPFTSVQLNRFLNNRNLVIAKTFEQVLAQKLESSKDRGVKEQDLYVLNASRMPGVLVEVGFLSNEQEAQNLVSPQWRHSVAEAIVQAIIQCL
ncbi:N-acetylmuramoyl-L-alanine amidase [Sphaerochaeta pleomorpha str. Grapes]|uniref:N-acetylmuramoyl-L-alanine amidase n=1 Tax=Sphaerochaeta pleomorpha (strain ATCC BAA-1885 / DSM 22778 / Grapes) TaxID=158190 RepID=G8QQK4_SPHPG|nr:N-acetylmuramoyl-L-alanine amidase [Sphaerochaeta pleomorpha]AEV30934.1 N-acetylmuramoyl-L-alanine amidase [Sphaerochaeta pleomorpha str. Grapes]